MAETFGGGCMCGAVRYTCKAEPAATVVCHCQDCQKHTGSAFATAMFFLKTDVDITGELKSFDKGTDAGNVMTRTFCGTCGSPLFSRVEVSPGMLWIKAGTLDDPSGYTPSAHIWTREPNRSTSPQPRWSTPGPPSRCVETGTGTRAASRRDVDPAWRPPDGGLTLG
mgnify:CR=1 FL=1